MRTLGSARTLGEIWDGATIGRDDSTVKAIDDAQLIGTGVARRLLASLAAGSLRDGDRIPSERALSIALQAPRSVVREALRSLALIGVLESYPGRGTFICAADSEWVGKAIEWGLVLGVSSTMDLVEARSHLEVISASLAAERRDAQDLAALSELVEEMQRVEPDREQLIGLDVAFHNGLARAAKSDVLSHLLESVGALLEVWISRVVSLVPAERMHSDMYIEHRSILEAVAGSDAERAGALMAEAMERGEKSLREALQAAGRRTIMVSTSELLVTRAARPRLPREDVTRPVPIAPAAATRSAP